MSLPSRWRRIAFALLLAFAGSSAGDPAAADAVAAETIAIESSAGASVGEAAASDEPVRARLVCDRTAIEPGGVLRLGVLFDIDAGWHLFWDGCNNTGYPITVRPSFPAGFAARELEWPAPERLVSPGDILDHVYARQVLVMLPVDVPRDAEIGSTVTLSCALEWVACREACVIGGADVSLRLPVAARGRPAASPHAALFERSRARVPQPLAPATAAWSARWEGETLILEAGAARSLAFLPRSGCEMFVDPLSDCAAEGSRLAIHTRRTEHDAGPLRGVLEIHEEGAASPRYVALEVPLSHSSAAR